MNRLAFLGILTLAANAVATMPFTTTEAQKILSPRAPGISIGFKNVPCLFLVQVTEKGDEFTPSWEVTSVDFSACPSAQSF